MAGILPCAALALVLMGGCTRPSAGGPQGGVDLPPGEGTRTHGAAGPAAQGTPDTVGEALFGPGGISPIFRVGEDPLWTADGYLRIVPIHHASVLLWFSDRAYYVDPIDEGSFHDAGQLEGLPKADCIFITHPHPDHLDLKALERLRKPSTLIVAPPSVAKELPPGWNVGVMANGDKRAVGKVGVEAVPMYNIKRGPSVGKLFHEKGVGDGFILTFGDKRVYLSGDTECTDEVRALSKIDVAFVAMNLPFTMSTDEAADCIKSFKPKIVYPYHYRGSDLGELDKSLVGQGVDVRKRSWY